MMTHVTFQRTWKFNNRQRQKRYAAVVKEGIFGQQRLLRRTWKTATDAETYGKRLEARYQSLSSK